MHRLVGSEIKLVLFVIMAAVMVSCDAEVTTGEGKGTTDPKDVDPSLLYVRHCVDCHGASGDLGLMGAKSLTTSTMTLQDRIELITHGSDNGKMKPFGTQHYGDLNEVEIEVLARYLETLRH
jgi:cytochrome c553